MRVKRYTIAPFDKKMERQDGALGRHFDEKDERTLLQNAKCKMQRSESRASSHTRTLCRATHAFDEVKCKGASAEHRVSLECYAERRMLSNVVQMQKAPRLTAKCLAFNN